MGKLLLLLLVLLFLYGLLKFLVRFSQAKEPARENVFPVVLLLLVKDQEQWVEGFLRKVADYRKRWQQAMKIVVVDDCSQDQTADILNRLRESCALELILSDNGGSSFEAGLAGCRSEAVLCFDARELKGSELLHASLFNILPLFSRR